ncbi:MAG: DEAD/DEAH box helicase family protein [Planctomycetaceae bacterium]|nr:DEAD/DEAH box helicase family protein [Planctomycetaceae bacterium]
MASFPAISFRGTLRPSQSDVVEIARRQLEEGETQLHVVAPPGSGKTILGLNLWAECVRQPALVLSPNSAIQAQWVDRLDLFACPGGVKSVASTDPKSPALLTSLTYQAVTLPQRGGRQLDAEATERWIETLVEKGQAQDPDEAQVWIEDLQRHYSAYYEDRLSGYRKEVRDEIALSGEAMQTLHGSALETLKRLKQAGIGLLILDECHHLLSHWGRVLADAHRYFDHPIILGLTATPPDMEGQLKEDVERYRSFFGPIDYEVPVPAVVKDGFLAPYQDLVQFVRPTSEELAYVARADEQLEQLVEELCEPPDEASGRESLTDWLRRVLAERQLPVGTAKDWQAFEKRDPALAWAGPRFLVSRSVSLPRGVPKVRRESQPLATDYQQSRLPMDVLIPVLDRYIRHRLRSSIDPSDHQLAEETISRLRLLGTQITETGSQACASPIGRVMAYAHGKAEAIIPILRAERDALGDRIRAIVVTDFEKTSAVSSEIDHLLDEEAGGAVAAFRVLLSHPETDALDPVLVTGSTVLVDDDVAPRFDEAAAGWLSQRGYKVDLEFSEEAGFHVVSGRGSDWCPRVYVAMVTEMFQQGITKCLVGTRGLLGEGWDASRVNVLIDLTTVTTSTSINQLRGRSLRLDAEDPAKLAHNWDVVCIAPEYTKGLDDYARFIKKHNSLFGLTDDGVIEKGVGHVHAAFTEIAPELVEESMHVLNAEMLERPARRAEFRALWRVGEPYHPDPVHTLEVQTQAGLRPPPVPFAQLSADWNAESLTQAIGRAVLGALQEERLIQQVGELSIESRAGGYVRAFLQTANDEDSRLFSESLAEALGPLDEPRYVIQRFVDYRVDTWLSRILPRIVGQYFQREHRQLEMLHAVPSALAKNKRLADLYTKHWNTHVSPGQPVYARSQEGQKVINTALQDGITPTASVHRKEVFLTR